MIHPPLLLTKLEAEFLTWQPTRWHHVDSIDEAQGVRFLCPLCFHRNGGSRGTHSVVCWSSSAGVPDSAVPNPGRWKMVGTGLGDLTLNGEQGKSRSVLLTDGCGWHGYVTGGLVTSV